MLPYKRKKIGNFCRWEKLLILNWKQIILDIIKLNVSHSFIWQKNYIKIIFSIIKDFMNITLMKTIYIKYILNWLLFLVSMNIQIESVHINISIFKQTLIKQFDFYLYIYSIQLLLIQHCTILYTYINKYIYSKIH